MWELLEVLATRQAMIRKKNSLPAGVEDWNCNLAKREDPALICVGWTGFISFLVLDGPAWWRGTGVRPSSLSPACFTAYIWK
jgi:hypothetical protein